MFALRDLCQRAWCNYGISPRRYVLCPRAAVVLVHSVRTAVRHETRVSGHLHTHGKVVAWTQKHAYQRPELFASVSADTLVLVERDTVAVNDPRIAVFE